MQTLVESYTDATRIALTLARSAADVAHAPLVAPEHVLGGLLREPSQEASRLLLRAGAAPAAVADLAERLLPARVLDHVDKCEMLAYARSTKLLIIQAPEEARLDGLTVAAPRHLLLALFTGERTPAVDALTTLGVSRDKLRAASAPDAP